jgi:hypothetical protein
MREHRAGSENGANYRRSVVHAAGVSRALGSRILATSYTACCIRIRKLAGRDGNDPSVDIAKNADQRF